MQLLAFRAGHVRSRLRQQDSIPEGNVWTRHAGNLLSATPVTAFTSAAAMQAVRASMSACLTAAGIPYRVEQAGHESAEFRVTADQFVAVLQSLGRAQHTSPLYATDGSAVRRLDGRPVPEREHQITVFAAWASPKGHFIAGPDAGVSLRSCLRGARLSVSEPDPTPQVGSVPPSIDAVYTWVDGTDPAWRARKANRLGGRAVGNQLHSQSKNAARYESVDELRFSLRSLDAYAPWIRHVFLVTDRQRPLWLVEDHPRLTVIDHEELFRDRSALPTFNSHAIETQLHHINGLSEHYLYFNDDVFLGRVTPPSLFFDDLGDPRVFLAPDPIDEGPVRSDDPPVVTAAKANRAVLEELTGHRLKHKLKHVPHPQRRSVTAELEARAPGAFTRTAASPFRSPSDISVASSLGPLYAHATGRAAVGSISHFYADVGSTELRWRLPLLLEHHDVDAICLNATATTPVRVRRQLTSFLERYFPVPSSFEV